MERTKTWKSAQKNILEKKKRTSREIVEAGHVRRKKHAIDHKPILQFY